jgi:AraC-like DNA-binding protein
MQQRSPFDTRPGGKGVLVRFADRRWYLQEWHGHERLEMNFVISGSGAVLLEDRKYLLQPGQLIWLWPGQRHIPSDWSADMVMWIAEWDQSVFRQLVRARGRGGCAAGDAGLYGSRTLPVKAMRALQPLLENVAASEKTDTFNHGMRFLLFALWDAFCAAPPVDNEQFLHPKLGQVMMLLNDRYTTYSLAELAKKAGLAPHYLSEIFHRQTGMSIPAYRNRLRLNHFFSLYRHSPELDLLSLALEAGFGSYAQFYRVFCDLTGTTPRAWLKGHE